MAIFFLKDQPSPRSDISTAAPPQAPPGSSARKFLSKDAVQNPPVHDGSGTTNSEHVIDIAADLKSMAVVVDAAAGLARESLQQVRDSIDDIASDDSSGRVLAFSQNDLKITQNAFAGDIAGVIGGKPGGSRMSSAATGFVVASAQNFLPTNDQGESGVGNPSVPAIDRISLGMDKKKGVLDSFFSELVFDLSARPVDSGDVRAVRIFRSMLDQPADLRNGGKFSVHGLDVLCSDGNRSRNKNPNSMAQFELRLQAIGIDNALSSLIPIDSVTNVRIGAVTGSVSSQGVLTSVPLAAASDRNLDDLGSFMDPAGFENLDRSVALDLLSLKNIKIQNPSAGAGFMAVSVPTGKGGAASNVVLGAEAASQASGSIPVANVVIDENNKQGFKEIAFVSPDKLSSKRIGDILEFSFQDPTISFGRSYRYYVVTVDANMHESQRSRIVQINVDGLRIPQCPRRVVPRVLDNIVSLNISVEDLLVEKFEVFRKEIDSGIDEFVPISVTSMSDVNGFTVGSVPGIKLGNDFVLIGESLNGQLAGSMFYDRRVVPGKKYVYRVYSVDIFGNKSECPAEAEVFVMERSDKMIDLKKPTILVEVDAKSKKMRIVMSSDDKRVTNLFLARRDLSINQQVFVAPADVEHITLGSRGDVFSPGHFEDVKLSGNSSLAWTGRFVRDSDVIVFVDQLVEFDRTYQYRLFGLDRFGNRTPYEVSRPVFISRKPLLNEPANLRGDAMVDPASGRVSGVRLTWEDSNLDISAKDRIGNRTTLEETAVRSLYQVQRRRLGAEVWSDFPLVENRELFDPTVPTDGSRAPQFRPEFLKLNEEYVYRVATFQSGGFVSNYAAPIVVAVSPEVLPPQNFRVKPGDSKSRPFFVMLNWDTDPRSGIVDQWEIERAAVNNVSAARLNLNNPDDFRKLIFQSFRTVFLESSRFREMTDDHSDSSRKQGGVFSGQHHFMDTKVDFGNTYFYRIRAHAAVGDHLSEFVYKGVKITDDTFEKKFGIVVTAAEVSALSIDPSPMVLSIDDRGKGTSSSFSLSSAPFRPDSVAPTTGVI